MNPVTLKELNEYALTNKVGVGMFNIVNLEFARAIFEAAQETGVPAMFGMLDRFITQFYSPYVMADICREMLKNAKTPLALHLDHGKSFEVCMTALNAGFTSIMFDGSSRPYEENVAMTAEIVKIAHAMGVSVEGELGYVGRVGVDANSADGFTKPEQAVDFVRRTQVDALAISIGNQHGLYKGVPKLDFERLAAIRSAVDCGLVLHGGSGIAESDFVRAIKMGITKVNIYTAEDMAALTFTKERIGDYTNYLDYSKAVTETVKAVVKSHIQLFAMQRDPVR